MTQEEFKAWFDGFCEGITGEPNAKQWTRIKARVKEIDGRTVTERIFIDHYRFDPYRYYPYWGTTNAVGKATTEWKAPADQPLWNSTSAMTALGSAEAKAL